MPKTTDVVADDTKSNGATLLLVNNMQCKTIHSWQTENEVAYKFSKTGGMKVCTSDLKVCKVTTTVSPEAR